MVVNIFGMCLAKRSFKTVDAGVDLTISHLSGDERYREAIASLMFFMVGTRPDPPFSIGKVAKYVEHLGIHHWRAVKRLFWYDIHTKQLDLLYSGTPTSLTPNCLF